MALADAGASVRLVGVVDIVLHRAEDLGRKLGVPYAGDAQRFLSLSDAAIVAVSTLGHYEVVRQALLADCDVLLLDSIGELAALYAAASVAFVGGTLAEVGGHNLLEPLFEGCPVVFGPNYPESARECDACTGQWSGVLCRNPGGSGRSCRQADRRPKGLSGEGLCSETISRDPSRQCAARRAVDPRGRRAQPGGVRSAVNWPWRATEPEGAILRAALSPVAALSYGYGLLALADRTRYLRGWKQPRRVDARVISVGSLVVGGSGKTPMASWLAERLHRRGHKVTLLSRGYGRRPKTSEAPPSVTIVSDGRQILSGHELAGDEPFMMARQLAGVPVVVSKDRGIAALRAISAYGADVLILDDGFQHHGLARDLDLVTFDADFGTGNGHLLPRGPLRESLRGLGRSDAIGEVDGALPEVITQAITRFAPLAFRFRARRRPVSLRDLAATVAVSPEVLRGMKVGIIAGIARPESLRRTLRELGAEVIAERIFRDHHRYRARDFLGLAEQASVWVTTEKDAVKILPRWTVGADLRVLAMRLAVAEADALVEWIEARLGLEQTAR